MKTMIHAFDIDGTVTNQNALVTCLAEEFKGVTLAHLTSYDIKESLLTNGFISRPEEFSVGGFFQKYGERIFAESEVADGFLDFLSSIKNEEICYITARNKDEEELTERLFHRLGIPYKNVYHVGDAEKKGDLIRSLGVRHVYEDKPETALAVAGIESVENVWLLDYPYTKHIQSMGKIHKFCNWRDLIR